MGITLRGNLPARVVFHTDRGTQYAAAQITAFAAACASRLLHVTIRPTADSYSSPSMWLMSGRLRLSTASTEASWNSALTAADLRLLGKDVSAPGSDDGACSQSQA